MDLFNEYYSSEVQCLLNLFSLNHPFSRESAIELIREAHVYAPYGDFDAILDRWEQAGLISRTEDELYTVGNGLTNQPDSRLDFFAAPLNELEVDALKRIINTPEAELMLAPALRQKLVERIGNEDDAVIFDHYDSGRKKTISSEQVQSFRHILEAIRTHKQITYRYRTLSDSMLRDARVTPYRIEYSVFDGRWWLISYLEDESRTVKSRLENISSVTVLDLDGVPEETIRSAIQARLCKDPVCLCISGDDPGKLRNVLERCFLAFENMQEVTATKLSESEYELSFRHFLWEDKLIVHKLLLLGEYVTVRSPQSMIDMLVKELQAALSRQKNHDK